MSFPIHNTLISRWFPFLFSFGICHNLQGIYINEKLKITTNYELSRQTYWKISTWNGYVNANGNENVINEHKMRKICGKYVETSFHFHASRNAVRTHRPDSWNRQLGQTDRQTGRQTEKKPYWHRQTSRQCLDRAIARLAGRVASSFLIKSTSQMYL